MRTDHWQEFEGLGYTREGKYVKSQDGRALMWSDGDAPDDFIRVQFAPGGDNVQSFEIPFHLIEKLRELAREAEG